jgi:hypothetical protein
MRDGSGLPSWCAVSLHEDDFTSTIVTISPPYVSYTPATQPHGGYRLDKPRRIRMLVFLDRRDPAGV